MADPLFLAAYPYLESVYTLPVGDLDDAAAYFGKSFELDEAERRDNPPTVIMERDGVQLGFAITGGDASNDGAAIEVTDIDRARRELKANGVELGPDRIDERGGERFKVFFVVAPGGLCFYFHQRID